MVIHLIDGTYELFRQFYGQRRFNKGKDKPYKASVAVLNGVLRLFEEGATHVGVATDHVIESFRNKLWAGYKTGEGIDPALLAEFPRLEESLKLLGVKYWPMVKFEADDALAAAAIRAAEVSGVKKICLWTPDKDLAQCVRGKKIVQIDSKRDITYDEAAIKIKYNVKPGQIADFLALVGDAAYGYPGIAGIGKQRAASLLKTYGSIEKFPKEILGKSLKQSLLFKRLATLRTDVPVFKMIDELKWKGPTKKFENWTKEIGNENLFIRAGKLMKQSK